MGQACRELEVSRSGYYGWLKHQPSERSRRNEALRRRLVELHEKYPAMGLDSLYRLLKPEFGCSRKRVHRQMRIAGISSVRRRAYKATTNSNHSHPIAPNLLMRNFTFERPDQACTSILRNFDYQIGVVSSTFIATKSFRMIYLKFFIQNISGSLKLCARHVFNQGALRIS